MQPEQHQRRPTMATGRCSPRIGVPLINRAAAAAAVVILLACSGGRDHHQAGPRLVDSLSTGAPGMACASMRPLHGLFRARPAAATAEQFALTQSALAYDPAASGQIIVELGARSTHSEPRPFRGFMVQAYDPANGHPVGSFQSSADARPIDSCSAATHRDPHGKRKVSLVWVPPLNGGSSSSAAVANDSGSLVSSLMGAWGSQSSGAAAGGSGNQRRQLTAAGSSSSSLKQVRFRATVVVSYSEFYTGLESSELKSSTNSSATATTTTN